jgi:hypothetical protein
MLVLLDSSFDISQNDLDALLAMFQLTRRPDGDSPVLYELLSDESQKDARDIFEDLGWLFYQPDKAGNVKGFRECPEDSDMERDEQLMALLAPFAKFNDFVACVEDGFIWQWWFDGNSNVRYEEGDVAYNHLVSPVRS